MHKRVLLEPFHKFKIKFLFLLNFLVVFQYIYFKEK